MGPSRWGRRTVWGSVWRRTPLRSRRRPSGALGRRRDCHRRVRRHSPRGYPRSKRTAPPRCSCLPTYKSQSNIPRCPPGSYLAPPGLGTPQPTPPRTIHSPLVPNLGTRVPYSPVCGAPPAGQAGEFHRGVLGAPRGQGRVGPGIQAKTLNTTVTLASPSLSVGPWVGDGWA